MILHRTLASKMTHCSYGAGSAGLTMATRSKVSDDDGVPSAGEEEYSREHLAMGQISTPNKNYAWRPSHGINFEAPGTPVATAPTLFLNCSKWRSISKTCPVLSTSQQTRLYTDAKGTSLPKALPYQKKFYRGLVIEDDEVKGDINKREAFENVLPSELKTTLSAESKGKIKVIPEPTKRKKITGRSVITVATTISTSSLPNSNPRPKKQPISSPPAMKAASLRVGKVDTGNLPPSNTEMKQNMVSLSQSIVTASPKIKSGHIKVKETPATVDRYTKARITTKKVATIDQGHTTVHQGNTNNTKRQLAAIHESNKIAKYILNRPLLQQPRIQASEEDVKRKSYGDLSVPKGRPKESLRVEQHKERYTRLQKEVDLICWLCDAEERFTDVAKLYGHLRNKHHVGYLCGNCAEQFTCWEMLVDHLDKKHHRQHICTDCKAQYERRDELFIHRNMDHKWPGKTTRLRKVSPKHTSIKHSRFEADENYHSPEFRCQDCDLYFESDTIFLEHCSEAHGWRPPDSPLLMARTDESQPLTETLEMRAPNGEYVDLEIMPPILTPATQFMLSSPVAIVDSETASPESPKTRLKIGCKVHKRLGQRQKTAINIKNPSMKRLDLTKMSQAQGTESHESEQLSVTSTVATQHSSISENPSIGSESLRGVRIRTNLGSPSLATRSAMAAIISQPTFREGRLIRSTQQERSFTSLAACPPSPCHEPPISTVQNASQPTLDQFVPPQSDARNEQSISNTEGISIDKDTAYSPRYHIPDAKMREMMLSSPQTGAAYWQYTLYQGPNGEKVRVHYCQSKEASERIAKMFLHEKVLGFDIEWKPQSLATEGIKKNVSLIQLASEERIALFHIARYGKSEYLEDHVAPTLKMIMESPNITKVGVSVKADCTRLRRFMGIHARGLFELSHLYKLVRFSTGNVKKINKCLVALAQQVEEHLQLPMWKGPVRSSDWSSSLQHLKFEQIQYAASDSYAGLQVYNVLEAKRKALNPVPPRPYHAELNLPIRLANGQTATTYDDDLEVDNRTLNQQDLKQGIDVDVEAIARDFANIAIEDGTPTRIPTPKITKKVSKYQSSEILAAEAWVTNWRSTLPQDHELKATPAYLRAYALWHDQSIDVEQAAALLRDPPLQHATVAAYIIGAVNYEKLPFDDARLGIVFGYLPEALRERFQRLRKACGLLSDGV